jgi:membrane-bound ClpP family serine protease
MWAIAGVLLGLVVVASLVGFHTGPHSHAIAGGLGIVAAIWLVMMAVTGNSGAVLWLLFGADVAVSGAVGTAAWKGLRARHEPPTLQPTRLEGVQGEAQTDLDPDGTVKVRGEVWSARSLNGTVRAGTAVQVINARGVRLEVWGEDGLSDRASPFTLEEAVLDEEQDKGRTSST